MEEGETIDNIYSVTGYGVYIIYGETDNIVHSLQCLCTQQVVCAMYMYIGTMHIIHMYMYVLWNFHVPYFLEYFPWVLFSHVTELRVQFKGGNYSRKYGINTLYIHVHAHAHVHVAHCTLNMYCIVIAPNIELSIHVDHLHTWQ